MSKNHDENKDLRLISRVAKVDYSNKTIQAPKSQVIGIRSWGRIDYLVNYCGWHFFWNNHVSVRNVVVKSEDKQNKREIKKAAKEPKLTNKKRK